LTLQPGYFHLFTQHLRSFLKSLGYLLLRPIRTFRTLEHLSKKSSSLEDLVQRIDLVYNIRSGERVDFWEEGFCEFQPFAPEA